MLDKIGEILVRRHEADSAWQRWSRRARLLADAVSVAYLAALFTVLFLLSFAGSALWMVDPLRFLPLQGWLLPMPLCMILCFVCRRWWPLPVLAVVAVFVLFPYMGWHIGSSSAPAGSCLRIVSNNVGQNNRKSSQGFLDEQMPDLFAVQDAKGRGSRYAKRFTDCQVQEVGEFVLISRLPILASGPVMVGDVMPAAWFDVDWNGTRIRLYNVHVPTPRNILERLRGPGVVKEALRPILRPGDESGIGPLLKARMALLAQLQTEILASPYPAVAAGDFNMPPYGPLYRKFAGSLQDGHAAAGGGWGMTFPGTSRNPLTGFGPWLRLDYVWASPNFSVEAFATERQRESQHRAIGAVIGLAAE